jgi:hypothetical protein
MTKFADGITYAVVIEKTSEVVGNEPHHGRCMSLILENWLGEDKKSFLFPTKVKNPHGSSPPFLTRPMFEEGKMDVKKLEGNFKLLPFPVSSCTEHFIESK